MQHATDLINALTIDDYFSMRYKCTRRSQHSLGTLYFEDSNTSNILTTVRTILTVTDWCTITSSARAETKPKQVTQVVPAMSRIPRGIPSVTYCRVLSTQGGGIGQGDIISDGNSITVLEAGHPSSRHDVAQVLPSGISDEDACELTFGNQAGAGMGASLNPITACVSDAVTAVIFIVGSKETRKWHFLKKTVLPFVANELFANIADRDQQMASSVYKAQINLSAFEIQDEIITDLLRPVNRGLSLAVTAEEGVMVQGLQSEAITDEMDLRRLLLDTCENRASHTLPPGGSIDTATAIFEFTLYQSEGGSVGAGGRDCHSRLLVVDVPSTDPLVSGGAVDVRQLQGPNLHKSLLTFLDVSKKLNTPSRAAVAPFRSSKLTHYLSELLGGNSIVVALGLLAHGEPSVTRKTLEIIGALSNALHYPIGGRELTDVLQGLLGKYRSMLMQLQDELLSRAVLNQGTVEHEMTLERQLLQVQRDLADALRDKNGAVEDRERVYEMAELLKAKFETLMDEKLAQSQELAQSKEDNVVLARSLMDRNLELVDFKEQSEKEVFDLASQLMAARNHIAQLEGTVAELQLAIADKEAGIQQKLHDMEVLRGEIAALNTQIEDRGRLIQVEKDKAIELGAELLTLVNRNDLLQKELDALTAKHDAALGDLREKGAVEEALKKEITDLDKELRHKEEQMFELSKHSASIELEAKQAKLEAEQLALQCKEKLLMLAATKPGTSNTEASVSGAKYEELQQTIRKGGKVIKDLERNLRRAQADLDETRKEKVQLAAELTEVREKYRDKLGSLLMQDGDAAYHHNHAKMHHRAVSRKGTRGTMVGPGGGPRSNNDLEQLEAEERAAAGGAKGEASGAVKAAAQLQQQLLDSYAEREAAQGEALDRALEQCVAVKLAYRELYDKYRATIDVVEEQLPKASAAKLKPLDEQLKFAEADLSQSEAYLDEMEHKERAALREKFEAEQQAGVLKNERLSLILATYQRNLEVTERKLVAAQQENIDLHIQIKQLVQNSSKLQHQIKEMSSSNLLADKGSDKAAAPATAERVKAEAAAAAVVEQQQQQYTAMYAALTEQIRELKDQMVRGYAPRDPSIGGAESSELGAGSGQTATAASLGSAAARTRSEDGADPRLDQGNASNRSSLKDGLQMSPTATPQRKGSAPPAGAAGPGPERPSPRTSIATLQPAQAAQPKPPTPAEEAITENNPHGFKTMAECLQYIATLEANSHQALTAKLHQTQQRVTELTLRNAALEEELGSYQSYMRDVVPQYKKQLQHMKAQLKVKSSAVALAAAASVAGLPAGEEPGDKALKLPLIK